jgi:hypothetical protein
MQETQKQTELKCCKRLLELLAEEINLASPAEQVAFEKVVQLQQVKLRLLEKQVGLEEVHNLYQQSVTSPPQFFTPWNH